MGLLVTLTIFSGMSLSLYQWGNLQRSRAVEIYQRYQAIQIAENQKQRLFLGLSLDSLIIQNGSKFQIQSNGDKITVSYPSGKIQL